MADPISTLPPAPSRADPANFSDEADALLGALDGFVTETNAVAVAMNLNDTNDVSSSSVNIQLGARTFTVTADKSFLPGMYLVIADDAAPSTNSMAGQITSYSGTTLIMNIISLLGSGTKSAWTISQSAPIPELGSAAAEDVGVANGNVPQMDATGYPAADGSQITGIAKIATGTYTGDGSTSQAITGIGFQPIYLKVWAGSMTSGSVTSFYETADILQATTAGIAIEHEFNETDSRALMIDSLDADGFTVNDRLSDNDPNKDGALYHYMAISG